MVIVGIGRSFDMIVTILSFSYKRGLPEDKTDKGRIGRRCVLTKRIV